MFLLSSVILSMGGGGGSLYDVTFCLAAWSHVPSGGISVSRPMFLMGCLCLWSHVPSGGRSLSLVPCSFQGTCNVTCMPPLSSNKAEPTLALKPRGDVTRSPKQGYQWPHKKDSCPPNFFLKKKVPSKGVVFLDRLE